MKIKQLLRKYEIFPLKRLGQNFLVDKRIIKKIIKVAELNPNDTILEIGSGIGNLTVEIAKRVRKVIAVEKDERMVKILNEILMQKNIKNVEIIEEDIFQILYSKTKLLGSFKIVANIPYYLTSRLIRNLLELENKPKLIVLMVQKEVAKRICSKPPKMNLLAVAVQFFGKPEIVTFVSKDAFWPTPKVDSAILKIKPKTKMPKVNREVFFKIVKIGFVHPRKQLINNFSKKLKLDKIKVRDWLLKNGINPAQRAETINIEQWIKLAKNFKL